MEDRAMTTILEMLGTVHPDGTLQLDAKLNVPPGRVRVTVESLEPRPKPSGGLVEFGRRCRREMEAAGHRFRTKDEIDRETEALRDEWDGRLDEIKRVRSQAPRQE
jgi:hypothetical protein